MRQIVKNRGVRLVLGGLGAIGLFGTISFHMGENSEVVFTNSFLSAWFCILSALLFDAVCAKIEKKDLGNRIIGLGYGIALSLALNVGKALETVENWNIADVKIWINVLLLTVYITPFILLGWQCIDDKRKRKEKSSWGELEKWKSFLFFQAVIFLCWIPVFLALYPGAFVYDAYDEYEKVATNTYTTHHPLAHVLLLGKFVCAGQQFFDSYNIGIAAYTLCQMIFMAGVFSYTINYIRKKTKNNYIIWGTVLFYGFFPVICMYAVCSSKDTIFNGAFLVVVIKILELFEEEKQFMQKKMQVAVLVLFSVIMMLFRNNGMHAYIVWIFAAILGGILLKWEKKRLVNISMMLLAGVVIFLGCSLGLKNITNAKEGGKQEILTVPIQQLVRTYTYSPQTFSEEEKELLFTYIPEDRVKLYNARLSDKVKVGFQNEIFAENQADFFKLWIKIGLRKPMIYLNAWLMTSYGYWYPDAIINVYGGHQEYTFMYEDSSYFGFETEEPGTRESKFPWLEEQYRKMSLELYQQKVPGISMLFSPGFLFWAFMFTFCYFLQKKNWKKVIPFVGVLLLWLTVILGPTYLVRYVLILWFVLPLLLTEVMEG